MLRRLISIVCQQATLDANLNAALQQAKNASKQAEQFMNEAEKLKVCVPGWIYRIEPVAQTSAYFVHRRRLQEKK